MDAIEAGECLDRSKTDEGLVDVHSVQKRLIESRLELLRDDQESTLRLLEGSRRIDRHAIASQGCERCLP